jgi:hypothetical protein
MLIDMDNVFLFLLKAGFMGYALSLGAQMLVFYVIGRFLRISERNFIRVFIVAGFISFLALDMFLYYKIVMDQGPNPEILLAGCIGGWLAGIVSGLTQIKRFLLSMSR